MYALAATKKANNNNNKNGQKNELKWKQKNYIVWVPVNSTDGRTVANSSDINQFSLVVLFLSQ